MSVNNPTFTPPPNSPDPMQSNQPSMNPTQTNRDTTVFTPERLHTDQKTHDISSQTLSKTDNQPSRQSFDGKELSLDDALKEAVETGMATQDEISDLLGMQTSETEKSENMPAVPAKNSPRPKSDLFGGVKKVFSAIGQFFGSGIDSVDLKKYKSEILKKLDQDINASKESSDPVEMMQNLKLNEVRNRIETAKTRQEVDKALNKGLGNLPGKIRSDQAIDQSTTTLSLRITAFTVGEKFQALGKLLLNLGKMPVLGLLSLPGRVTSGIDGIRNGLALSKLAETQMKQTEQRNALGVERELLKNRIDHQFGVNSMNAAIAKGILNTIPDSNDNKLKTPDQLKNDLVQELKRFNISLE